MALAGVSDIVTDWRARMATRHGFGLFGATDESARTMRAASKDDVLDAFRASSRIGLSRARFAIN